MDTIHKCYIDLQIFCCEWQMVLKVEEDGDDNMGQSCRQCSHSRSLLYWWENRVFVQPLICSLDHCGLSRRYQGTWFETKKEILIFSLHCAGGL